MKKVQIADTTTFNVDVPYKLIETGKDAVKPLIIYLHGYKQNLMIFENKVSQLFSIDAYHLIVQGPYPIYDEERKRKVANWGRAWYLYDGEQNQFVESMEKSSRFIETIIEELSDTISMNRVTVLGYSMGGYLAGYFALSRPGLVDDLIVIGGRIKTELFEENRYKKMRVLALHGAKDSSVSSSRQKASCEKLQKLGAEVIYRQLEEKHRLSDNFLTEIKQWMIDNDYSASK